MATADTDKMKEMIAYGEPALQGIKGGYRTETLAGNITLDFTYPSVIGLDPTAARTVVLDGGAAVVLALDGARRRIINKANGAETITVDDFAATEIVQIDQDQQAEFYHDAPADGTGDGWVLVSLYPSLLA